jgi:glycosyltransferase involved in cell wall biosynthesis
MKISIVIPVFNREKIISETLDSILYQSYRNWECLLIDDGSTDNVGEICNEYVKKDPRFKYFQRNRVPKGAPTCRNIGLEYASGDYIIFLDSDDILHENCLKQRIEKFREFPNNDFLVFKSYLFEENITDAKFYWNLINDENLIYRFLKLDVLWQTSGPIYRKSYLNTIGGFSEDLLFWQDYELHLRCLLQNPSFIFFSEMPADLYIRQGSLDTISRKTSFTSDQKILQKRIDFYFDMIGNPKYKNALNEECLKQVVVSVVYYFCAQFIIRHSNNSKFRINFNKIIKRTGLSRYSYFQSILFAYSIKISRKYKISLLNQLFVRLFKSVPDYHIFDNNKVGRIKIDMSE